MTKKAQIKDIFSELLQINFEEADLNIILSSFPKGEDLPKYEKVQLVKELTDEFRSVVSRLVKRLSKELESNDLRVLKLSATSKPDLHEIEYIDTKEDSFLNIGGQIAPLKSIADIPLFQGDKEFVSGLRFYVLRAQEEKKSPVYFFRIYSAKKELSQSKFFAAIMADGHFDRVKKPLFLFDHHLDCAYYKGKLFVFKKDNFQKIFRYFEMVEKSGKAALRKIKKHIPIIGFDEFEKKCERHLQKLAKLRNISEKRYLEHVKIDDMKKVIVKLNLDIKTKTVDGKEQLVFDSADPWGILKLLDDDYLESIMTGLLYEVSGKREHEK